MCIRDRVTGCGKKNAEETTAAPTESSTPSDSTEAAAEKADPGKLTKLGTYKGVEVKKNSTEVTPEELEQRIQGILDANPEYIEICLLYTSCNSISQSEILF